MDERAALSSHQCRLNVLMSRRLRSVLARLVLGTAPALSLCTQVAGQTPAASSDSPPGQQLFSACAACHGLDGRGGEHAPNIATDADVQRLSDSSLQAIIRNGIPAAGMPGFSKQFDDQKIQAVLQYLRILQGSGQKIASAGNGKAGRELFFGRAGCAECHMVKGEGGFLGADLSGYSKGRSAAEIVEAIVTPDKNLDPHHGTVTVLTRSGKRFRGVVRNEDNFSLQMQTADGSFHLFDKSDLVLIEHEVKSLMPSDYGSKLTSSQLDDLVSFLLQTGGVGKKSDSDDDQD